LSRPVMGQKKLWYLSSGHSICEYPLLFFEAKKGPRAKKSLGNTQLTNEESTMSNNVWHPQSSDVHQSDNNRWKKKFLLGTQKIRKPSWTRHHVSYKEWL